MRTKIKTKIFVILTVLLLIGAAPAFAHCDSYDGPVIKDALKALETNNVELVYKWISQPQEAQIKSLFTQTYNLKNGDKEIYSLVQDHFFETLVRLHRETEGFPFTGLKEAGTTKPIVLLTDKAIATGDAESMITELNNHIAKVVRQKFNTVKELSKVKDSTPDKGRAYVKAYVDYTHTVEALHDLLEHKTEGKGCE